jgi:hypothetical protein
MTQWLKIHSGLVLNMELVERIQILPLPEFDVYEWNVVAEGQPGGFWEREESAIGTGTVIFKGTLDECRDVIGPIFRWLGKENVGGYELPKREGTPKPAQDQKPIPPLPGYGDDIPF